MSINKIKAAVLLHGNFHPSFFKLLKDKKIKKAFVLEARPNLDGARILCRKLLAHRIQPVLIADNMAGFLFFKDYVREAWIAYQKLEEENLLCPIGSLILGILAKRHKVVVHAFPSAGRSKPRANVGAITHFAGKRVAIKGVKGFVPLIETVSKEYISEIYL